MGAVLLLAYLARGVGRGGDSTFYTCVPTFKLVALLPALLDFVCEKVGSRGDLRY
jgi:hypothetical protein